MENTYVGTFVGGHPALDFTNSVSDSDKSRKKSRIGDWDQFKSWAHAANVFPEGDLKRIDTVTSSAKHQSILDEVHNLREATYNMLSSIVSGDAPSPEHQALVEAHIKLAINNGVLCHWGNTYEWTITIDHPDWIIGTLALSIESLTRSPDFRKLRECGRCSWLFLDTGRGKGRKWCDMRKCGNRSKSQSFRNRQKQ